jgi:hypothetical protein
MIRKPIILFFMLGYIYTLALDIFLNSYFNKIPAPLLFCSPLVIFFFDKRMKAYLPGWETLFFLLAGFFYYVIGQSDPKSLAVNGIVFVTCAVYFNFFVGANVRRFNFSVLIFYLVLSLSTIVMLVDHIRPIQGDLIRSKLLGADVIQSPSGISGTIFLFGYQLAALVGFVFIFSIINNVIKKYIIVSLITLLGCLLASYFGMQRSVFVSFTIVTIFFCCCYYGYKSIPIISGFVIFGFVFFTLFLQPYVSSGNNILNKTNMNAENGDENRSDLVLENLKIYSNYPFGLIFYGKQWKDVTKKSPVFYDGLTSHNAYLMFFTYLGPILGGLVITSLYYSIFKVLRNTMANIRKKENAILVCLCFSFLAISINALFHNAWLGNANGPTVFLYIAVLHCSRVIAVA